MALCCFVIFDLYSHDMDCVVLYVEQYDDGTHNNFMAAPFVAHCCPATWKPPATCGAALVRQSSPGGCDDACQPGNVNVDVLAGWLNPASIKRANPQLNI